ncbi:MAG: phosphate signaling complex protein PhoU [Thermoanaerobacteraceae bacterium]|uniref:phosphate signaling complex protein PhoU n=1 Tax=Thermanaeromonas sp. C210 TaxID=2731925 RepID=UPI00155CB78D|nr:phosphate signaling complex protein PhoU [Thermanaeromonas sp. C210]MBE3581878.1 phosphate signaling complex protein PhoU [Thermoanaerobacteraceae bacterium]GFN22476.1 phosphate transport system regulatory protein PhoU [Thermanaeromonas sp. C210]
MEKPLSAYDRAILQLEQDIMRMGEHVRSSVAQAMEALVKQDVALARQVIEGDVLTDDWNYSVEEKALELISLQQPLDRDLRALATVMRVGRELERVGDYAENIAETAIRLADKGPYFKPLVDIPRMAELAQAMLHRSLEAFVARSTSTAREVIPADDEVDRLFESLYEELIEYMKKGPQFVDQASYLSLVARYLERIADHAVNIAEMVIFRETGIRRPGRILEAETRDAHDRRRS